MPCWLWLRGATGSLIRSTLLGSFLCGCAQLPPATLPVDAGPGIELTNTPFFPQQSHQCGPAALATVLRAAGADVSPEQLVPQTYLPGRHGSLQLELIAAARRQQRIPYVLDPNPGALLTEVDAGHPVLVLQNLGVGPLVVWHYAVVIGYQHSPPEIVLRSGVTERLVMPLAQFMRSWQKADQWALVTLAAEELPATAEPGRYVESIVPLEALGDYATAHAAYTSALVRWPDDVLALFGAANSSHRLGQLQSAQRDYLRLVALAPNNPIVLNNLAEVLQDQGCPILAGDYANAAMAATDGTGELAMAIADTQKKVAKLRAHQQDGPDCRN